MGRRTQIKLGTAETNTHVYTQAGKLLWAHILAEGASRGPQASRFTKYVYLGNHLIARQIDDELLPLPPDEALNYLHTDGLGSPVAATTPLGALVAGSRVLHEPYGLDGNSLLREHGPGFTGHVVDSDTGLSYMQQRYYDPIAGRFLSPDPIATDASNGTNFNRYWYANNNPYKFVDPDGRQACGKDTGCRLAQGERGGTIEINPSTAADRATQALNYLNKKIPELSKPYETPEKAKNDFGKAFARKSKELGVEFGANIVEKFGKIPEYLLRDFQVSDTFIRTGPLAGYASGVPIPGRPNDPSYWGFVHTHPVSDGDFSVGDIIMARDRGVNKYVIFPDESSRFQPRD